MATRPGKNGTCSRQAFTFIDVLLAIAVIGILLSCFLPAIQAAREATRNSQCQHHLRRIAFGCQRHERTHKTFPYGGWSFGWVGDPDQGIGPQQPGSWVYTTGPYMNLLVDFDLGAGLPWKEKKVALGQQIAVVVPVFYCPSRRAAKAYPAFSPHGVSCENGMYLKNAETPPAVAKTDYAINGGTGDGWDDGAGGTGGAPPEYCLHSGGFGGASRPGSYPDCPWHIVEPDRYWQRFNGVSGWRIGARVQQISDGVSKTILVGEKAMQPYFYEHSCPGDRNPSQPAKGNRGDNGSMYLGWDPDIARTGGLVRDHDEDNIYEGIGDRFGGPHARGANFAFCDGSVRSIRFDVENFARFVTRNDREASPSF